jgi:hypothetical protein
MTYTYTTLHYQDLSFNLRWLYTGRCWGRYT